MSDIADNTEPARPYGVYLMQQNGLYLAYGARNIHGSNMVVKAAQGNVVALRRAGVQGRR
jgi:hypothetical protein